MATVLDDILIGLLTSAIWASLTSPLKSSSNDAAYKKLEKTIRKKLPTSTLLNQALVSAAKATSLPEKRLTDKVRLFLISPEVSSIIRKLYTPRELRHPTFEVKVREEFELLMRLSLGEIALKFPDLLDSLFSHIVSACDTAIAAAIEDGCLSAHELQSGMRHAEILSAIDVLDRKLDILRALSKPIQDKFLAFERKYRTQVAQRHKSITPPNFDTSRKVPLDELYVTPTIVTIPKRKEDQPEAIELSRFIDSVRNTVLLGNPGGGKSTLSVKLCHDLAKNYGQTPKGSRALTPVLVILREYGNEKKERQCSLTEFIELKANANYQVPPPVGAFDFLFASGRALVIFDGLDELLDTTYRQEISADVESFSSLYPDVPILITSREVGYSEAPLDRSLFDTYLLANFNEKQVEEYAKKWFAVDQELSSQEKAQKTLAFVRESSIVGDLRSNPLMLALMCNIYRGEGYIPKNRPDVYEKCAVMLFERWDKSRDLHVVLPFEAHITRAMRYLAHWIYLDATLQGGVTEGMLVRKTAEYLHKWRFDDLTEAETAASKFIDFCRGRAWVFTDVGTTKEGERLYQFTHRTFLEYFTAYYLVSSCESASALRQLLIPHIAKEEWDVVAQLAVQIQHKGSEGAGDEMLTDLGRAAKSVDPIDALPYLIFSARCLAFLIPQPRVVKTIAESCIELVIKIAMNSDLTSTSREMDARDSPTTRLFGPLLASAAENRSAVGGAVQATLDQMIKSPNDQLATLALELAMHLEYPIYFSGGYRGRMDLVEHWKNVSTQLVDQNTDALNRMVNLHIGLARSKVRDFTYTILDVVNWFGLEGLFFDEPSRLFPDVRFGNVAQWILSIVESMSTSDYKSREDTVRFILALEGLGKMLSERAMPWATIPAKQAIVSSLPGGRMFLRKDIEKILYPEFEFSHLSADAKFAVLAMGIGLIDINRQLGGKVRFGAHLPKSSLYEVFPVLVGASERKVLSSEETKQLRSLELRGEQEQALIGWIEGNIGAVVAKAVDG
jgi:NACHT domain